MLIRTWNVFHGNTSPPQRRAFPADAVRLAVEDDPDVVCLQEVPAWSLPRLADWSGYEAVPVLAQPPTLGPLPSTAEIGRASRRCTTGSSARRSRARGTRSSSRPGSPFATGTCAR